MIQGRRQNYTFWCYLFLETRFLVKVHMKSNENNLYYLPCSIENPMSRKILSGRTGFNPKKM